MLEGENRIGVKGLHKPLKAKTSEISPPNLPDFSLDLKQNIRIKTKHPGGTNTPQTSPLQSSFCVDPSVKMII